MPMHQADREEVVEKILLKFDVGEVMVIIPQVTEADLIVASPRMPTQRPNPGKPPGPRGRQ